MNNTKQGRILKTVGPLILLGLVAAWFQYGSYILASTSVTGGLRGKVFLIIRTARHGLTFNEVSVRTDEGIAVIGFSPNAGRILERLTKREQHQKDIDMLTAWCEHPPPAASFFEQSAYVVGLRCTSLSDLRTFTVAPDQVPVLFRNLLEKKYP